jgi:alpha-2-macroglobulin
MTSIRKFSHTLLLFSFCFTALYLVSCKEQSKSVPDTPTPQASPSPEQITYLQLGVESPCYLGGSNLNVTPSSVKLILNGPPLPEDKKGQTIVSGITLSPHIAGTWSWLGSNQIFFIPTLDWTPGTEYTVTLQNSLLPKEYALKNGSITFSPRGYCYGNDHSRYTIQGTGKVNKDGTFETMRIKYSNRIASIDALNKPLLNGVSIKPALEGIWEWETEQDLVFKPSKPWNPNTEYEIETSKDIYLKSAVVPAFAYTFKTDPFKLHLTETNFYTEPTNVKSKKILTTLLFNYPIDKSSLEKRLHVKIAEKDVAGKEKVETAKEISYQITYPPEEGSLKAYLSSEEITVPPNDSVGIIEIDQGYIPALELKASGEPLKVLVEIPGIDNYFKIKSVSSQIVPSSQRNTSDQLVLVETSALLALESLQKNIKAYLLPKNGPPNAVSNNQGNNEQKKAYTWDSSQKITPEILSTATQLTLSPVDSIELLSSIYSFKATVPQDSYVYITIDSGLTSSDGYSINKSFEQILYFGALPKSVAILAKGSLLNLAGEKKVSVLAREVSNVEVNLYRILPTAVNFLMTQTEGALNNPSFRYEFQPQDIGEKLTSSYSFPGAALGQNNYMHIDFNYFLKKQGNAPHGLFLVNVKEKGSSNDYNENNSYSYEYSEDYYEGSDQEQANSKNYDNRLILVTDMGIIVKENRAGSKDLFVQSLSTGSPVENAEVNVLGRNGLTIFKGISDKDGHVLIPQLSSFTYDRQPTIYTVNFKEDFSFLPYDKFNRRLNFSKFDVGGVYTSNDGLQAYLFTDRGVYRPGDTVHVGSIVKSVEWKQDIAEIPLEAVFTDSKGTEIKHELIALPPSGFHELLLTTLDTSFTGKYNVSLYLARDKRRGTLLGNTSFRVEEFLPDRMKIQSKIVSQHSKEGWYSPENLSLSVALQNLFGTPAAKRRITGAMTVETSMPVFTRYKDFTFHFHESAPKTYKEDLGEIESDKDGNGVFTPDISKYKNANFKVSFFTKAYEPEGGRYVSSEVTALVSTYPYLIGYKANAPLSYIKTKTTQTLTLLAVDSDLNTIDVNNASVTLHEIKESRVLVKKDNGMYAYQSVKKEYPILEAKQKISKDGTMFKLYTEKQGMYRLRFKNDQGNEINTFIYSVFGGTSSSIDEENTENFSHLEVNLNKEEYNPGEEIELSIRAPYAGAGLITVETDKVHTYKWFKTETETSLQKMKLPEKLQYGAYVNVSFVRSLHSKEVYLSPFSYAVKPFKIATTPFTNTVDISASENIKPGDTLSISYQASKPSKGVLYIVDEGILQVARYTTPNPLDYFFRKRALEVQTAQILDLILPEYSIYREISGIGGDQDFTLKHLNPFKRKTEAPVVYWSGIIDFETEKNSIEYKVPEYFNGELRIIGLTVGDTIGVKDKSVKVKGDLVILPNLPTSVSPGDTFEISGSIANNLEGSDKKLSVQLSLMENTKLEFVNTKTSSHAIAPEKEERFTLSAKARDDLGGAKVELIAAANKEEKAPSDKAEEVLVRSTTEVSIRPVTPYTTTIINGQTHSGSEIKIEKRPLYPFKATRELSISPLPLSLLRGMAMYLVSYPYGCTEQVTSKAIPALVLKKRPELGGTTPKAIESLYNQATNILLSRQTEKGALSYWGQSDYIVDDQNTYAGLFITEAKDKGMKVPVALLSRLLDYLKTIADKAPTSPSEVPTKAMAIYILTRNNIITTSYIQKLYAWLEQNDTYQNRDGSKGYWRKSAAGLYLAASYKLLKMEEEAQKLIAQSNFYYEEPQENRYSAYSYFYNSSAIHGALYLYLTSKHFENIIQKISTDAVITYFAPLLQNNYNTTITSAYAILGIDAYIDTVTKNLKTEPIIAILKHANSTTTELKSDALYSLSFPLDESIQSLKVESNYPTLYYQITEEGYSKEAPKEKEESGLSVFREYKNEKGEVINEVNLGERIFVTTSVKLIKPNTSSLNDLVIVDMLPGGFEVEMSPKRMDQISDDENFGEPPAMIDEFIKKWGFGIYEKSTLQPRFAQAREDRILLFGELYSNASQSFMYAITPTNRGTFQVPPVYAEAMYNRSVYGIYPGGSIKVK